MNQSIQMLLTALIIVSTPIGLLAQSQLTENTRQLDSGSEPGKATLEEIRWLTGHWQGEGLGGKVDEMWSPPASGTMVGTFRLMKDGKLAFSEYFVLSEIDGSLTLQLKHFDADFVGWEEKEDCVTFRLIEIDGHTAWFDGLTYRVDDDGQLTSIVAMKRPDGTFAEGRFQMQKSSGD